MKNFTLFLIFAVSIVMPGCASTQSKSRKIYTRKETTMMTYCVGLTDIAMDAAAKKNNGESKEQVIQYYSSKPKSELTIPLVEKVYTDTFSSPWNYAVSFFEECSQEMAGVANDRVGLARYCMQNQFIAYVAYTFKTSGSPKKVAYDYFAALNSDTPKKIVDRVYSSSKSVPEITLEEWNLCMSVLTSD